MKKVRPGFPGLRYLGLLPKIYLLSQAVQATSNKQQAPKELYTPTANHIVVYNIAQHAFTKERFKTRRVLLCLNG